MAKLFGAQRLVLQAIQDSPKDAAGFVTDVQIVKSTNLPLRDRPFSPPPSQAVVNNAQNEAPGNPRPTF